MHATIRWVIEQLNVHIRQAWQSGDKYDFIDPAAELCGMLERLETPGDALEPLFMLIENSPDMDYGGPGPLGAFLESLSGEGYEEQLIASLRRKPTVYTLHLLDACLLDNNDTGQATYLFLMTEIAAHTEHPGNIREEARAHLAHAMTHIYPSSAELSSGLVVAQTLLSETATQRQKQQQVAAGAIPTAATVFYSGIRFKLINRQQAGAWLPVVNDIPGMGPLYDLYDEQYFPLFEDNGFFLLAEEDVVADQLAWTGGGPEGICVLGFIFLKNLRLNTHLIVFDTARSPVLIVHGDLQCPRICLSGNRHYMGGRVTADLVWARPGNGLLCLDGHSEIHLILADAMQVFVRALKEDTVLISMMGMNIYVKDPGGPEWLQRPGTGALEAVFLPGLLVTDADGCCILREEGSGTLLDQIKQQKKIFQ
ncbi:hypothetical protein LQ567_23680 [Niabella pedocola]|uniref:Uncharacterized protein n=1 Tax=Niabella pedocola TaxID=1752077 RepID=A0ABS8PXL0_9BACT|nr:hypothetical protein [Niabella pedocola]MCD2425805.1 hypothetical protein [Niabella pedocola]